MDLDNMKRPGQLMRNKTIMALMQNRERLRKKIANELVFEGDVSDLRPDDKNMAIMAFTRAIINRGMEERAIKVRKSVCPEIGKQDWLFKMGNYVFMTEEIYDKRRYNAYYAASYDVEYVD